MPESLKKTMELLAPAGDEASLRAAVCAGANAVYLGFSRFGARASAANFDAEMLEKAVAYAHLYHVRIHVTVNTLVKPQETADVLETLGVIYACGADAVIVQDLGVAHMARAVYPSLELHASTQMAIHSAAGARFAMEHGFRRVVLARECTLQTIEQAAATGADIEVFVHGALCAGVSGQCLLSSMAGGRSGNRGRCAQPCRQQVTLGGTMAALLSTRDLCLRDHLPELEAAGVAALKIEGRLKRPEYVAVVTDRYRRALDALARGEFAPADEEEKTALKQVFHRGGFTVGHALGAEDAALCAPERVNHGGVSIGKILAVKGNLAETELTLPLHDGDSLRIEGAEDVELRYSGPETVGHATLRLRPDVWARPGDPVVRLADAEQLRWAQNLTEKQIPVTMRAEVLAGKPLRLTASDGISVAEAVGEPAQTPRTRPLTKEEIIAALSKLGDTPFVLAEEPTADTDRAFAPVSALNALRRNALEKLADMRRAAFSAEKREAVAALGGEARRIRKPRNVPKQNAVETLAISFTDAQIGQDFLAAGANLLLYAPTDYTLPTLLDELPKLPVGTWLVLPPQMSDEAFAQLLPTLSENAGQLAGIVPGSVGQLGFPLPLPFALGEGVPITNPEAAQELLSNAPAFFTLWPELNYTELTALLNGENGVPPLLKVYGRERLMLLNHCPERVRRGLTHGREHCALCGPDDRACAAPDPSLTDRRGYDFPLRRMRMPEGCVVELLNALPTDLSGQDSRRKALGTGMLLSFTVEPPERQLAVTRRFAALMRTGITEKDNEPSTTGHFLRGVE